MLTKVSHEQRARLLVESSFFVTQTIPQQVYLEIPRILEVHPATCLLSMAMVNLKICLLLLDVV